MSARAFLLALIVAGAVSPAQSWRETCGQTAGGVVALRQATLDATSDTLVLLVASHPDDRYVLPAVWLRYCHGARIAVLLATRGGGGQNSTGPESGDALERIRTLETEAGCSHFDGKVWYLNRPDGGYRRTAEETYGEWGREDTLRDLVRLLRTIRPDVILTTHHRQESHGHDLALVDLLTSAVPLAADAEYVTGLPPHRPDVFALGATTDSPTTVSVPVDRIEPVRGSSMRSLARDVLRMAHKSPGRPAPLETLFEPVLRFELQIPELPTLDGGGFPFGRLRGLFDDGVWPGDPARARALDRFVTDELPTLPVSVESTARAVAVLTELRTLQRDRLAAGATANVDIDVRLQRRIEALERVVVQFSGAKIVLDVPPGTNAIAGEEFTATVYVYIAEPIAARVRAEGFGGVDVVLEAPDEAELSLHDGGTLRAEAAIRLPLQADAEADPMAARFRGDRFVPPVRIRFHLTIAGTEVPLDVTVPVEERAPVELSAVPRILLLPKTRRELQFSVAVVRNTRFPVEGDLEVRAQAGYAIQQDRRKVSLREYSGDTFQFQVRAAEGRRSGVDVFRIALAGTRIALPVHKVDVVVPPDLRIGVLRSRDNTLPGILGVTGLGLAWSELSDADISAGDLSSFDTIVVDVRALRGRPGARRGFRRLLEFAAEAGHRLVVFYHKKDEFHPKGEGFIGAPFAPLPFKIGKARVTRSDAPVRILLPQHVLLNHPNTIRPSDWDGWSQERALYLPEIYPSQFEEIVEIHDPGQPAERGALLYAKTGEGDYVYCALALWRQLKKLHPGAVRLLANLLTPASRN